MKFAVVVLLMASGVTAYSLVPLAMDDATLPAQQMLVEAVTPLATTTQASAEQTVPMVLYRSERTRQTDSVVSLLRRLGVSDSQAANFLSRDTASRALLTGSTGKFVSVKTNDQQQLQRLTALWPAEDGDQFFRLVVEQDTKGYLSRVETGLLKRTVRLANAEIRHSLTSATKDAKLPPSIAKQLLEVFSGVVDVQGKQNADNRIRVVYEALEVDGETLGYGKLLGAELTQNGQRQQVMWFQEVNQRGRFYTLDGQGFNSMTLLPPLDAPKVSSNYGMRMHPVFRKPIAHEGTDLASPTGTPVRSAADGIVTFAGWKQGYGKFILVKHRNGNATAYAHLGRIQVNKGQRIAQGDLLGTVGQTGTVTGSNLHFEYLVNGRPQDPRDIALPRPQKPFTPATRNAFLQRVQTLRQQLDAAPLMAQANAE